jgi:hypothetical protein
MAKQTFTTGQVLTATQMNNLQANDYNWSTSAQTASYVLVAGDKGQTVTMTNAGATTITVNTAIFAAGDTVRVINLGAGTTTITAGTATVNSAGPLALPQYGSGTLWFSSASAAIWIPDDRNTGFVRVGGTTFTTAASVAFANDTFTSTYKVYYVVLNITATSTGQTVSIRVRDNSGSKSGANYFGQAYYIRSSTATLTSNNTSAATSQVLGRAYTSTANNAVQVGLYIANPTSATSSTTWWGQGTLKDSADDSGANTIMGTYSTAEAHTGLEFFVTGTITGSYNVYGLAEA